MRISCPLLVIELSDKEIALVGGYAVLSGLILLYWSTVQGLRGPLVCVRVDFQEGASYDLVPYC